VNKGRVRDETEIDGEKDTEIKERVRKETVSKGRVRKVAVNKEE
jgi:hypothetical protein